MVEFSSSDTGLATPWGTVWVCPTILVLAVPRNYVTAAFPVQPAHPGKIKEQATTLQEQMVLSWELLRKGSGQETVQIAHGIKMN